MGLTQFLPSDYLKYAVDFDGDGRADIWNSVPDALASAAKQLVDKGWQRGLHWAYEVHRAGQCRLHHRRAGKHAADRRMAQARFCAGLWPMLSAAERAEPASLFSPPGFYGPSFLATKNYFAIKEYNFSDLYVLFVGHLSDRITDPRPFETPWGKVAQLPTARSRPHAANPHRARLLPRQDRRQSRHEDPRRARRLSEAQRAEGRLLADRRAAGAYASDALTARRGIFTMPAERTRHADQGSGCGVSFPHTHVIDAHAVR